MTEDELRSLEPGAGVYWHELSPPYRLWFGVVVAAESDGEITISIPGRGRVVHSRADRLHCELMQEPQSCPYCQATELAER